VEGSVRERQAYPARGVGLFTAVSLLVLAFLLSWGCGRAPEEASVQPSPGTPGAADLVIALLPERNVFEQKIKYLPLQEYLANELGIIVYFKLLDNYESIFSELQEGNVDGAFWGSMNGAITQVRGGVEMLARPLWPDNSSTYWGYIFTLKGSGISSDPATWRGRSIAFVNKVTTAGFLYPLSVLRQAGITENPGEFFSRAIFSGSHDASLIAVLQGEIDMGACKNTIFHEFVERNPEAAANVEILTTSAEVPSNGLGVRPGLDQALKTRLKETLLSMHEDPQGMAALNKFGALKFIETSFEDYSPVLDMAGKAGIDLSDWPLRDIREARPYR
jgi:phosphonate transport system substrate-binding protein